MATESYSSGKAWAMCKFRGQASLIVPQSFYLETCSVSHFPYILTNGSEVGKADVDKHQRTNVLETDHAELASPWDKVAKSIFMGL